jgi:hypothetical protein
VRHAGDVHDLGDLDAVIFQRATTFDVVSGAVVVVS